MALYDAMLETSRKGEICCAWHEFGYHDTLYHAWFNRVWLIPGLCRTSPSYKIIKESKTEQQRK